MVMAGAAAKQLGNTSGPIICCMRGRVCRGSQGRNVPAELLQQFLPRTSAAVQDFQGMTSDCGRQVWCTCACLIRTWCPTQTSGGHAEGGGGLGPEAAVQGEPVEQQLPHGHRDPPGKSPKFLGYK